MNDRSFWEHQAEGLAVFVEPGNLRYFKLPVKFEEVASVNDKYFIKPLIPFYSPVTDFYLLVISQEKTKLYHGSRFQMERISAGEIIDNIDEFMEYEDPEKQLQFHTGTADSPGQRSAMFHGHGVGGDDTQRKEFLLRFMQNINRGVSKMIAGSNIPLIIAGIEYVIHIYRKANSYPDILEEAIEKNPDDMQMNELHRYAVEITENRSMKDFEETIGRFNQLRGMGKSTSDLSRIVKDSHAGKIDTLLVDPHLEKFGGYNKDDNSVTVHDNKKDGDEDLVDAVFRQTVLHDGNVHVIEPDTLDSGQRIAAILRY
ncbi:MAG: hypothetical protein GF307_05140 [candidate division Zixibacteria bacterium]|nr:hypothetical protein [candidate division Zixibacteria bacterium]